MVSLHCSDICIWPLRVPDNVRIISDPDDGILAHFKKGASVQNLSISCYSRKQDDYSHLEDFLLHGFVYARLRSASSGILDIFLHSSSVSRSLSEKGCLPQEAEMLRLFHHLGKYCFASLKQPVLSGPVPGPIPLNTLAEPIAKHLAPFAVSGQYYDYSKREFYTGEPDQPQASPNISVMYLPFKQDYATALPLLKQLAKSIAQLSPPNSRGRKRVDCILMLDDTAPKVDTRLLTPETLSSIGILRMTCAQYTLWCGAESHDYEGVVKHRHMLFMSNHDIRFSPRPADYQWRIVAYCEADSSTDILPFQAHGDWNCMLFNLSAFDYATAHGATVLARNSLRWFGHAKTMEMWGALDAMCMRVEPAFKCTIHVTRAPIVHAHEKALERKNRSIGADAYMASLGFLWDEGAKTWSQKLYNRTALKTNGVLNCDFIDKCYDGFTRESAQKLLADPPACPICDQPCNRMLEQCGHLYCDACITGILEVSETKVSDKCPECRKAFYQDDCVEIKRIKPRRRTVTKDIAQFARLGALREHIPESIGPMQQDMDDLAIVTLYNCTIDTLQAWAPNVHIISLETLVGPPRKFSKLLLLSPIIPSLFYLDTLHQVIQSWTAPKFQLCVLCLENGASSEDMENLSALAKCYNAEVL